MENIVWHHTNPQTDMQLKLFVTVCLRFVLWGFVGEVWGRPLYCGGQNPASVLYSFLQGP